MCHTGTSNGGKKWQMALFQVGSWIQMFEMTIIHYFCVWFRDSSMWLRNDYNNQ